MIASGSMRLAEHHDLVIGELPVEPGGALVGRQHDRSGLECRVGRVEQAAPRDDATSASSRAAEPAPQLREPVGRRRARLGRCPERRPARPRASRTRPSPRRRRLEGAPSRTGRIRCPRRSACSRAAPTGSRRRRRRSRRSWRSPAARGSRTTLRTRRRARREARTQATRVPRRGARASCPAQTSLAGPWPVPGTEREEHRIREETVMRTQKPGLLRGGR